MLFFQSGKSNNKMQPPHPTFSEVHLAPQLCDPWLLLSKHNNVETLIIHVLVLLSFSPFQAQSQQSSSLKKNAGHHCIQRASMCCSASFQQEAPPQWAGYSVESRLTCSLPCPLLLSHPPLGNMKSPPASGTGRGQS